MKNHKGANYISLSLLRYSVLILNKIAMASLNVSYTKDSVYLGSHSSPVFDPTIDTPPDYSLLSPFANNGGYEGHCLTGFEYFFVGS